VQEYFILDIDEKKKEFFLQFTLRFKEYRSTLYIKYVKDSAPTKALD
jgi:hypothetical protein